MKIDAKSVEARESCCKIDILQKFDIDTSLVPWPDLRFEFPRNPSILGIFVGYPSYF